MGWILKWLSVMLRPITAVLIDTNKVLQEITQNMLNRGQSLPHSKYKKSLKPYWDSTLTELNRQSKQARLQWINAGKPRNVTDPIYIQYKDAKMMFRAQQRHCVTQYEIDEMQEIEKRQDIDQRYFWYMVNKYRRQTKCTYPIQDDYGNILINENEIRNEWTSYYKDLYNWDQDVNINHSNARFINEQLNMINNQYMPNTDELEDGPVQKEEIKKVTRGMSNNKAPGWDTITAEHLKYGGEYLIGAITWLINGIVRREKIPQQLKRGLIVPIPKADKDRTVKDNNRGITLLSVLYKVLEKVILLREQKWFQDKNNINELQGAGKEHCSCLHTSMVLQEVIAQNLSKGESVYVAFLDIKKAFDTVFIPGLMYKLYMCGMRLKPWRLIQDSYTNYEYATYVAGRPGSWFIPERGIHQGAPLSMHMYLIYINELINQLRGSPHGAMVSNIDATSPGYADDLAIASMYKTGLNNLVQTAYHYSKTWLFEFSVDKSLCMCGEEISCLGHLWC